MIWATAKSQNFPHAILSPGYPLQSFAFHDLSSVDAFPKQKDFHYYPCRGFAQSIKISQKKDHPTINDKLSLDETTKTQSFHKEHYLLYN